MLRVRAARRDDVDAFAALAEAAGTGFTSLALGRDELAEKLEKSELAFASTAGAPREMAYQMMLEDTESGEIVGCSAVKDAVGLSKPYYDFKIVTLAQSSHEADRRFDMEVMFLVNDFAGCTEVGTLFVGEKARGNGAGRLVAQTRYLLIAADYSRFGPRVLAELRGVVRKDGSSPFFDHVTRPFFRMTFDEADRMSAASDNQFILDLMPKHPIYLDILPEAARKVIGKTHEHGKGARALLEWEGFTYDRYIDIFDGGPLMSVPTRQARTGRESQVMEVTAGGGSHDAIVTTDRFDDFRAIRAKVALNGGRLGLSADAQRALGLAEGDKARVWSRT
ncbi:arginine N-succinyltransferase [Hyphobacterium sp. HN65]|uniref:Arginine N-succinyltransferase n=1 Tax=Hyphobacterium lacteum TaxID=3116575 RepID=A0ABU7LTD2_9PROT|nr:arginine N-succinyltransferase [Hyphobacterium sp. HN65]MEE2527170.1 arginine N-succinyltransferase [Hyphobacterium sp. HN65]